MVSYTLAHPPAPPVVFHALLRIFICTQHTATRVLSFEKYIPLDPNYTLLNTLQ